MSPAADLYSAWFCPFAQRAWIAVLYRGLDIGVKEQDPRNKTPEWLAINPRGLVPALVHNGRSIYESALILEYLDDTWVPAAGGPRVMPADSYVRFQARLWGQHVDKKLVQPFYQLLQCHVPAEQETMRKQLLEDLKHMFDEKPGSEDFYLGDEPGYVDFMLVPFVIRYKNVLKELRQFEIPEAGFEKFHAWYAKVSQLSCVKQTIAEDAKVVEVYRDWYVNAKK